MFHSTRKKRHVSFQLVGVFSRWKNLHSDNVGVAFAKIMATIFFEANLKGEYVSCNGKHWSL